MVTLDNVWVTVPVGEREQYLPRLLMGLVDFYDRIVFVNNHRDYSTYPGVHHVEDFGPTNIYRWWNVGINYAQRNGAEYVAVLNDDLEFDNDFIKAFHTYLVGNNLAVADMHNTGNGGGAAWIMDLSYGLRLDERYRWYYGDTELFNRAIEMGKFGKFVYDNFRHLNPNGHLVSDPKLGALVAEDEALYWSRRVQED